MTKIGKSLTLDDLRTVRGAIELGKKWEKTEEEGTRPNCTCKATYEKDVSKSEMAPAEAF